MPRACHGDGHVKSDALFNACKHTNKLTFSSSIPQSPNIGGAHGSHGCVGLRACADVKSTNNRDKNNSWIYTGADSRSVSHTHARAHVINV